MKQELTALQQRMVDFVVEDLKEMLLHTYMCLAREYGETSAMDAQYTQWVTRILTASDTDVVADVIGTSAYATDKHLAYFFEEFDYFFGEWCNEDDFDVVMRDEVMRSKVVVCWEGDDLQGVMNLFKQAYIELVDVRLQLIDTLHEE